MESSQDTHEHGKTVDLSVLVHLSKSPSNFNVAGFDSFEFKDAPGDFYAFPAALWHRSGKAYEGDDVTLVHRRHQR